jgi:nucleotide-binding universal stress UspA family protein
LQRTIPAQESPLKNIIFIYYSNIHQIPLNGIYFALTVGELAFRIKVMTPQIMVLFDSAAIRPESLRYSIELAKRMNSNLTLLVILPFEVSKTASNGIEPMIKRGVQAQESLKNHIEIIRNAGISVEAAVRIGNPKSELLKYVAEAGRFEIIVWGARPDLMKKKDHWLVRMQDTLECPVVTPFIKNDVTAKYTSAQRP